MAVLHLYIPLVIRLLDMNVILILALVKIPSPCQSFLMSHSQQVFTIILYIDDLHVVWTAWHLFESLTSRSNF